MMNVIFRIFCFHTVLLLYCEVYGEDTYKSVIDALVPELYSLYKEAFITDKKSLARRMFMGDKQFMLHVQKLREVNGLRTHNLKIEQKSVLREPSSSLMYINNPVEAKLPNAFLTVEQFKNAMVKQVEQQKKEFTLHKNIRPRNKIVKKIKHTAKVNLGTFNDTNVFTHVIQKNTPSTDTPTENDEKYETLLDSQGNEITELLYNVTNDKKVDVWTETATTVATEAKILATRTRKAKSKRTKTTTTSSTESTSEAESEELTETWATTTLKRETEISAEETTNEFNSYNGYQEETTETVKSTVRTPLPRPLVFLGSQNY